jgi:RHS repeat-associated protein
MFGLVRRFASRLILSFLFSFSLIYGPVISLRTVRAEKTAPIKPSGKAQLVTRPHKEGEIIVKFKQDAPPSLRDLIVQTYAGSEKQSRGRGRSSTIKIKDGLDLSNTIFNLKLMDAVIEYAEPNYIVTRTGNLNRPNRPRRPKQDPQTPNDSRFGSQWALSNTGQNNGAPGSDIGALAGWQRTTGSEKTIIAVIDTGVDTSHPDLAGNLWVNKQESKGKQGEDDDGDGYVDDLAGWNFVNDSNNVTDDHGHGTAMAGIIAAEGDNREGIAGVMWRASIMPLKALDNTGSGTISDVVEAIDFAATHGASVINCSFGTDGYSQALLDAINRASMSGALVVTSAGNEGRDLSREPYYPASYTAGNLITVGATANGDQLAEFSNWGEGQVQIAAPGIDILTTYPNGDYVSVTGTSAAAPLVAGVAGLLKTIRGWVSAQAVRRGLIDGARKTNFLQGKVLSGGVVSAGEAIAVFTKPRDEGGSGGGGGNGGGGNGGGGNGGGGGGNGGGSGGSQTGGIDLDYLRNNRPNLPEPRVRVNLPPCCDYEPPAPGDGYGDYYAAAARPENAVGGSGKQVGRQGDPTISNSATGNQSIILGSQNINFTAPVVSLGGRNGLGVNLALSYNSHSVWLRDPRTGKLAFNFGRGIPAPGWSIGFGQLLGSTGATASIPPIWNPELVANTYIWVEPDGTRRTLVTTPTTPSIYTSNDSTNIEYNRSTGVMRLMNGTQIRLSWPTDGSGRAIGNEMLPSEIKDRNGNFITITNGQLPNGRWVIDYVTDTLGHMIDFSHENNVLTQVRQSRGGAWRVLVNLGYAPVTIQTNFTGVTLQPSNINGQTIWVPWFIEFPNQMNYRFFYTSYGQAYQIEKWVPTISGQGGERPVALTWYDLPSVGGQSSPLGPIRAAANNGSPQSDCPKFATREEWVENWSRNEAGWVLSGDLYVARYSYHFFSDGSGTHSRITDPIGRIFRTDVSTDGLTHTNRIWTNMVSYGSDGSPGAPLKTGTTIYTKDATGMRPTEMTITDGGATRRTTTAYGTLFGAWLPVDVAEYENGGSNIYRHTKYIYNTNSSYGNLHILGIPTEVKVFQGAGESNRIGWKVFTYDEPAYFETGDFGVIQHDGAYGTSYVEGRANLTTVTELESPGVAVRAVSHTKYDKTGMVVSVTDAANHTTQFFYEDNFLPGQGVGQTHALPTRVKDPGGFWSGGKYDWYTGNPVESYHIAGTSGAGAHENVVTYGYDGFDRPNVITRPDGGQTAITYWDNLLVVTQNTLIDAGLETRYQVNTLDGAGRTRWGGGNHPDGVSGKYQISKIEYDSVGRAIRTSHPVETDENVNPTGDDAQSDFQWTQVIYDALDRQDLVIHPDNNDIDYSYNGCGCAGGSTVTIRDERSHMRKLSYDFLGRLREARELSASMTTYSRARYNYDARDLLVKIEHFNGDNDEGAKQERTLAYDGYGRLQSQTTPEAGTISYEYWENDLVKKVTDARGISGQFTYNNRNLLTDIDYSDGTPDVHYEYGGYGERTLLQEKSGSTVIGQTDYSYDSYKRLQSETRQFQGLQGDYSVSYAYNLVDALKQVTYTVNSWIKSVNYEYTSGGALAKIGTNLNPLAGVSDNVMKNLSYRAFGALKSGDYGNGRRIELGYNANRLNLTSHKMIKESPYDAIIDNSYDYYGTTETSNGRVRKITDNLDPQFTTTYQYDDYDRLASATSVDFERTYSYDPWGNLTAVTATGGGETGSYTLSYATNASGAPLNNRINNAGHQYDAAGNMTQDPARSHTYDAVNRLKTAGVGNSYEYDGDGWKVKQVSGGSSVYYLWSSVLGQPVVELTSGGVNRAYVYSSSGQLLGLQATDQQFYWVHTDHLGSGKMMTNMSGEVVYRGQFDPHGQMVYEWASDGQMNKNPHKFTGYERDTGSDLDYAKARMYTRFRGRFMSPDPMGLGAADLSNPQSLNLYSYVGNDLVNFVDPTGMHLEFPDPHRGHNDLNGSGIGFMSPGIHSSSTWNGEGWTTSLWFVSPGGGGSGGNSGGKNDPPHTSKNDKLNMDELPSPDDPNLDDCKKKGEALSEVFKSVRRRRVELDRSTPEYKMHQPVWAKQKMSLNKFISNFKDNDCGDGDLPPEVSMKDVLYEATAPAPKIRNVREFVDSGGLIPVGIAVITAGLLFPWLIPTISPSPKPVGVR